MADNNGRALREAKACLADTVAMTHTADRLKTALAALVEAVEAAPVMSFYLGDTQDQFVVNTAEEAREILVGQRVRVLAVGEQP